jgi:two-component system cell cycle sensor histidine kinase/response regulator CckA
VDLVILDYRLPGERTGLDVYGELKTAGFNLPVIMVTGFSDEATVIKALRSGVRDFVTKSADYLDYLPEAVARALKQVRTERQLARSEGRLAGIIRSATDAILTLDNEQRITLFNAAAEQIFRCCAADVMGQPIKALIPETADGTAGIFEHSVPTGHLCGTWLEMRGVRADGEAFCLETSISSAEVAGENLYIVIVRDITERKQAQQRLQEQATLIDQATNAILVCELDGCIRFWNQGATRLYGWTTTEVIDRNAQMIFQGSSPTLQDAHTVVIENGEWSGELRQRTKDGKEVIVESRWTLMRDERSQAKNILFINTDITEKKKIQAQLLRTQRMESIGTLAGGIAHDLNNVLTPILMAVELLKTNVTDPTGRSLLTILQTSAERGADMVKQVLSFARGAEGQRVPLQLKHVIHDVEKMVNHTLPKSIAIRTSIAKDLWAVSGNATQLHQVLMNLCVNARDAMPQGGQLTITAENTSLDENFARMQVEAKPGSYVLVTVADTGTGIHADILDKIFDPFFTTKELGKGTGLGLSTVAGIVKNHGGFITPCSEVGKGTEFSIYFPAIESAQTKEAKENCRRLPVGDGELILVVDDEVCVREITRATLEAHGYRVTTAKDGTDALALYARHQGEIQAVVIDMMMPILDGPTTIRALQQLDSHARIIAVGGMAVNGKADEVAGLGVQTFLPKPFTAERLLTTLRELLQRSAASVNGRSGEW